VLSAVLVRLEAGEVSAVVVVHTNTEPLANSLPTAPECRRGDIYLVQMLYETKTDGACIWANHMRGGAPSEGADPVWRKAAALLARPLPTIWLAAGFWIGDRRDVLEVRYHFAAPLGDAAARPEASWSDSAWAPSRIVPRSAHDVAVRDLLVWIGAMAPLDQFGFYRRLAGYRPVAMPWSKVAAAGPPLKELRLRQLQELRGGLCGATRRIGARQRAAGADRRRYPDARVLEKRNARDCRVARYLRDRLSVLRQPGGGGELYDRHGRHVQDIVLRVRGDLAEGRARQREARRLESAADRPGFLSG
jgi:hypothetical protein